MKVSVYEAKSKLSQMLEKALAGEEVVITRRGEETVKLVPISTSKSGWLGMWAGKGRIEASFYTDLELVEKSR